MFDLRHTFASVMIAVACSSDSAAQEVSQFRGPQGNGVFPDFVPQHWSSETNLRWSADIPGGGWSAPVYANDRVYVTSAVSDGDAGPKGFGDGVKSMGEFYRSKSPDQPYRFQLLCLNASDGKQLWNLPIVTRVPPYKIHPSNSYATESPVTDGKHVYTYFASVGVVACVDLSGKLAWTRELGAYKTGNDFGTGSSLAMLDDQLFVQCDNEQQSFVCALDAATGNEVWRNRRDSRTSWSSPIIWKNRQRSELVVCGSDVVTSYDPHTGEVIWKLSGTGGAFSASPTFDAHRLYLGQSGRNSRGPLIAINTGASGDIEMGDTDNQAIAWVSQQSAPGMCSPVVHEGRVYVLSRGILSCHQAETGTQIYKKRLKNASSVTASLWASGSHVFAINESGDTFVVRSGDSFKLETTNSIEGLFWSTPSVTDSALLVRSAGKLHCIADDSARN